MPNRVTTRSTCGGPGCRNPARVGSPVVFVERRIEAARNLDISGAWGGFVPRDSEQREALTATLRATRVAAINWLLAEGHAEMD